MSSDEDHRLLFDLISKMLEYEPAQRITLVDSLRLVLLFLNYSILKITTTMILIFIFIVFFLNVT